MAWDDGVWDPRKLPVKEVDVRATDLAGNGLQKDRSRLQDRIVQLPQLNRSMGSHHDCRSYAHGSKVGSHRRPGQEGPPMARIRVVV
jgi:hypothetical protein